MSRSGNEPLLDAAMRLDSIPVEGREIDVLASKTQREAIAERLGILGVDKLAAKLKATLFRGGVRISGILDARVTQECVITFEPVHEAITEPLERIFLPERDHAEDTQSGEVFIDLEGEDLPDHFDGPELDFSEYLIEALSLALTPFPKAPGASVDSPEFPHEGEEMPSPFAGLAALKSEKD